MVKQCILTTVMYIWRHDICHVTASRWCHICQNVSPIPSNRYAEAILAIEIVKKVTGEKRQGVVSTPLGVRGLNLLIVALGWNSLGRRNDVTDLCNFNGHRWDRTVCCNLHFNEKNSKYGDHYETISTKYTFWYRCAKNWKRYTLLRINLLLQ